MLKKIYQVDIGINLRYCQLRIRIPKQVIDLYFTHLFYDIELNQMSLIDFSCDHLKFKKTFLCTETFFPEKCLYINSSFLSTLTFTTSKFSHLSSYSSLSFFKKENSFSFIFLAKILFLMTSLKPNSFYNNSLLATMPSMKFTFSRK